MIALEDREREFLPGQKVWVKPTHYDATPAWMGTVVAYHRNGDWIIREPKHNTICAYHATRLSPFRRND